MRSPRCLRAFPAGTKIRGFQLDLQTQLFQGNTFMIRRSLTLCFLSLALAVFIAGCSGPDAPPKKGGGTSGKSLTTAAP